ncbi:hypothetical protein [Alistipes sp. ZOR0009]|uniref:hypothetical protein n=1 Tax=Alistipes sp. ZOR0009 TaxID=1339253 RepID=UPI000AA665DA|nr:hypothetical protein [Alistipes sp. ZOR0009]
MKKMDKKKAQEALEALSRVAATLNEQCADDPNTMRAIGKIIVQVDDLIFRLKRKGC